MFMMSIMITILFMLIGVAFLTLMGRKMLSYIQIRKGPNKVGMMALVQPISDAVKMFFKEYTIQMMSNYIIYMITPMMVLLNALLIWSIFPFMIVYHLILENNFFFVVQEPVFM